jgi:hypothetical protein
MPPPTAQKVQQAVMERSDTGSGFKNPTAAVSQPPLAHVPASALSAAAPQSPSSQGNGLGGWLLLMLVALIIFGKSRRSRRRKKSTARAVTRPSNPAKTTKTASGAEFRIHPSSLVNTPKLPIADRAPKRPDTSAADHSRAEARRWLASLPSPGRVPFGVLAGHAIGTESARWTIHHRRQINEALLVLGYAMEPGPEEAADRLDDGTIVQVFRYARDSQSRSMVVACAAAVLVAGVAKTGTGSAEKLEECWLSQLAPRLALLTDQMTKLRARLAWLRTNDFSLPRMKRMLGEATLEERELCAWSATVATGATGTAGRPQIAMLEAIYDALSIPRAALYTGLHASLGAASVTADEPVAVSEGLPEILHPIPRSPTAKAAGPDVQLRRIRAETERVSAMLADIYAENEAMPEMPGHTGGGPVDGLDAEHSALLSHLLERPEWPRTDFDAAATALGLMPDGAMETINEWAFDKFDNAMVADGDPVVVNRELLSDDLESITAAK